MLRKCGNGRFFPVSAPVLVSVGIDPDSFVAFSLEETRDRKLGERRRSAGAIDAAHIDPYDGPKYNHPAYGLLLRKDLHCLFDNDLLGFEPTSGLVYFGTESAQVAYAHLHGKRRLTGPQPLFATYAPDAAALRRRWKAFCRAHGDPRKT